MSYEIIYDKQFIKLPKQDKPTMFVPLIFCGSNNCTEFYYDRQGRHRERRERGWHCFSWLLDGAHFGTQEQMIERQNQERNDLIERTKNEEGRDKYDDSRFGYFSSVAIGGSTRNTTFGQYQGIVKTGCKNALTVEELVKYNISVKIFTGSDYYSKEKFEKAGLKPFTLYPYTTEEFLEMYEAFIEKTSPFGIPCYIQIDANQDTLKRLRRTLNPKKKTRQLVEVEKWWSISIAKLGTFAKFTARGTKYSAYSDGGKQYTDEVTAERALKRVQERIGTRYGEVSLETHNTPTRIWVTKYETLEPMEV